MAEKDILALSDASVIPTDEIVFSHIGERKILWKKMLEGISGQHKNISWNWNYYNDGHQWLFKLVQKKKTILWGAILSTGEFRITFYFADKAMPFIDESDLPPGIKEDFRTAKKYGQIRPVTLLVNSDDDVDIIFKLADIKVRLK